MSNNKINISFDLLTIMAIATIVYIIQNVLHEALGHGGVCLLVGGKPLALSTAYFDWQGHDLSAAAKRFIAAAGTLVNLAAGLLFWIWLRLTSSKSSHLRFFLWLAMTVNLLTATGYPLFSGALNVGDWVAVVKDYQPAWAWRIGLIFAGVIFYALSIRIALTELTALIGDQEPERFRLAFKLSLVSYLAGSVTSTIGSFLNPISMLLVATSAASTFGGTSALAWMTQLLPIKRFPQRAGEPVCISRNRIWIVAAGVLLMLHILILGPALNF